MFKTFQATRKACYIGYLTQAIVINYIPLLYVTFQTSLGLTLSQISLLICINFGIQMLTDIGSAPLVARIGNRASVVLAHILCGAGMIALAILPNILPYTFPAVILSVVICSIGGGLIEVMVSPILEACPSEHKSSQMSLLHSFYCWGQAGVVLVSTLIFLVAGVERWPYIACFWGLIPLVNAAFFAMVPIRPLVEEGEGESRLALMRRPLFWAMMGLMLSAGACEITMSQWASTFAEMGLGVSKAVGDLLGPCMFALFMGISRILTAILSKRISLYTLIGGSFLLCILSYVITVAAPLPILSLLGCGLCGLSVGAMWPGTYSIASEKIPRGGFPLFALLACGGDIGCTLGPTLAGQVASHWGGDLKIAFTVAILYPLFGFLVILGLRLRRKSAEKTTETRD